MQKTEKEMLLNVMGHLIALDKRKARDDAHELISSAEFKVQVHFSYVYCSYVASSNHSLTGSTHAYCLPISQDM
jgi:hypothetical protein